MFAEGVRNFSIIRYDSKNMGRMDSRCCLCSKPANYGEYVLANISLIPMPWICQQCAEQVSDFVPDLVEANEYEEYE